nr:DUF4369 domain-containing protein [Allomuricauda sp.]
MTRILSVLAVLMFVVSCGSKSEETMTVSGNIKGLKKGTLYLQHFKDSSLVALDSLELRGDGNFTFVHEVAEPEVFYLYLDKKDNNDINDRITFFGEAGDITINTSWNTFDMGPEINGSESHKTMEKFNSIISKFNIRELELHRLSVQPEIQEDTTALDSIQKLLDRNTLGIYRYAINFGLNNGDSYATPYLVLSLADGINPKYLDSVYSRLSSEVAASKYGKALQDRLPK